jgi:hypothetical protein
LKSSGVEAGPACACSYPVLPSARQREEGRQKRVISWYSWGVQSGARGNRHSRQNCTVYYLCFQPLRTGEGRLVKPAGLS